MPPTGWGGLQCLLPAGNGPWICDRSSCSRSMGTVAYNSQSNSEAGLEVSDWCLAHGFFSSYQCYSTGAYLTLSLRWCSEKASRMSFLVPFIDRIGGFQLVTSWRAYGPPWRRGALPRTVSLFASDVNRHSCPSAMCSWLTLEHTQQWDVPTLGGDCGSYLCGHWLIQPGQAVHEASHWICGLATFVLAIAKLRNL